MQFISCSNDLRKYLDMPFEDNIEFNAISTDTRSIEKDSLFIAIKGPNFNGNNYIDEAFKKGAVVVLCSDEKYKDNPNKACIYVSSVKDALIQIATNICDEFKGKKILVTGSNGKTTCTFLISNSLPNCSSTIGNFNNEIGLPLSVMQADRESEYLVLEAGAGKPGDIAILSQVVKPHLGLITSISESHTEFLGDIKGVFNEKTSMFKFIQNGGAFIIGAEFEEEHPLYSNLISLLKQSRYDEDPNNRDIFVDAPNLDRRLYLSQKEMIDDFNDGINHSKRALLRNLSDDMSMMEFDFTYLCNQDEYVFDHLQSYLIGFQNMKNIILVANCLRELNNLRNNYSSDSDFLNNLRPLLCSPKMQSFNRLKHSSWLNGAHLIDDSYNANPASVKAAIEILSFASKKFERRILILGDMLELNDPIKSHVEIGNFIYDKGIDVLITFGDLAEKVVHTVEEIAKDRRIVTPFKCLSYKNEEEDKLKSFLEDFIKKDDIVIIKGSRGMRMERFI